MFSLLSSQAGTWCPLQRPLSPARQVLAVRAGEPRPLWDEASQVGTVSALPLLGVNPTGLGLPKARMGQSL